MMKMSVNITLFFLCVSHVTAIAACDREKVKSYIQISKQTMKNYNSTINTIFKTGTDGWERYTNVLNQIWNSGTPQSNCSGHCPRISRLSIYYTTVQGADDLKSNYLNLDEKLNESLQEFQNSQDELNSYLMECL